MSDDTEALRDKLLISSGFYRWCHEKNLKPELSMTISLTDVYGDERFEAGRLQVLEQLSMFQKNDDGFVELKREEITTGIGHRFLCEFNYVKGMDGYTLDFNSPAEALAYLDTQAAASSGNGI